MGALSDTNSVSRQPVAQPVRTAKHMAKGQHEYEVEGWSSGECGDGPIESSD
jgi:hypothetical protein